MGRMTEPATVEESAVNDLLLCPRFGVEQVKADGSLKVRPVDNFSWGECPPGCTLDKQMSRKRARKEWSVNGFTAPSERIRHDTIDELATVMTHFVETLGSVPGLLKAGIVLSQCCQAYKLLFL